jgi:hypothetical protein
MPLPSPEPGLVISYAYLWRHEHNAGREEGRKDRPCVMILAIEKSDGETVVTVAPITHSPPQDLAEAVEIPVKVKENLKLDSASSWVILNEANTFTWPGYDLRLIPGSKQNYAYGYLPPKLFESIKTKLFALAKLRRSPAISRD